MYQSSSSSSLGGFFKTDAMPDELVDFVLAAGIAEEAAEDAEEDAEDMNADDMRQGEEEVGGHIDGTRRRRRRRRGMIRLVPVGVRIDE